MRSESTSALGHPKLTNPTLGILRWTVFNSRTLAGFACAASGLSQSAKKAANYTPISHRAADNAPPACAVPIVQVYSTYQQNREISVGAYRRGADLRVDLAVGTMAENPGVFASGHVSTGG